MSEIIIEKLNQFEINALAQQFETPWSNFETTKEKLIKYFLEQEDNKRICYIAKIDDIPAGYANLIYVSKYQNFSKNNIPEINDLWVHNKFRNRGIATKLIKHLEMAAIKLSFSQIGIGVGLYADYGAAQKLYVKLGYIPDGLGITYDYVPVAAGKQYAVDDELILWLNKKII